MIFMRNIKLNISLPDTASATESELKTMLAAKLYERKALSLGQAARVAGLSKRVFTELLGSYTVSLFTQDSVELRQDASNA
jgi:predicted HTH domain antitoxin